jgi:hypothetical protein
MSGKPLGDEQRKQYSHVLGSLMPSEAATVSGILE